MRSHHFLRAFDSGDDFKRVMKQGHMEVANSNGEVAACQYVEHGGSHSVIALNQCASLNAHGSKRIRRLTCNKSDMAT